MKDVLGMELQAALARLGQTPCRIEETDPRRREPLEGPLRVIRQREQEGVICLTVCRVPDSFRA